MNILMTLSQLEVTGAEVYAATIADLMIKKGHNVYIISDTFTKNTNAIYFSLKLTKRSFLNRIYNIIYLVNFIKKHKIEVIHAHSRASGWVSYFAAKIANIPLITTVHGRQHLHKSRKLVKAFGDYIFAVCENIKEHLIKDLSVNSKDIEVLRNGINTKIPPSNESRVENIISVIGRLSGPKGDMVYELIENILINYSDQYQIKIIGGITVPEKFNKFKSKVDFIGYINNVDEWILKSKVIFGAGRVAVEAIFCEKPVIAIGESRAIGYITKETLAKGLASNFGDIVDEKKIFDWNFIKKELDIALKNEKCDYFVTETLQKEFDINVITDRILKVYKKLCVIKKRYEVPVLMYHRVIKNKDEIKKHGTYVFKKQFENHLKILKKKGYKTITFEDFEKIDQKKEKYIILTFDDGYKDNYENAFPLLKKYRFKAVIYLMGKLDYNKWDFDEGEKKFSLMNNNEIMEMMNYGIEFGAHTNTHPDLTKLNDEEVFDEINGSKSIIEKMIGKEIISFAYPYGKLNEKVKEILKKSGFKYAVATDSGPLVITEDLFQIRRIPIFPNTDNFGFLRKISGKYNFRKNPKGTG